MCASGHVGQDHDIPPCARSSKRAVRPISGIALDECRDPERYRTCVPLPTPEREAARAVPSAGCEPVEETGQGFPLSVPIAQSTERACPKRQVAGESPAGDTSSCGCGSTAECGRAKAETTVRLRSPAPSSGGVAHQQSPRLTCERQRGQHSPLPPFSEGTAQPVRAGAPRAPGRRRESNLTISVPVV